MMHVFNPSAPTREPIETDLRKIPGYVSDVGYHGYYDLPPAFRLDVPRNDLLLSAFPGSDGAWIAHRYLDPLWPDTRVNEFNYPWMYYAVDPARPDMRFRLTFPDFYTDDGMTSPAVLSSGWHLALFGAGVITLGGVPIFTSTAARGRIARWDALSPLKTDMNRIWDMPLSIDPFNGIEITITPAWP